DRLVPELELAARVLEDDAQLGDEHAPELLHELGLREAQRERQAEGLDVVVLDQLQLAREALEVEGLADDEREAELGVEPSERRAEHLADLGVPALRRRELRAQRCMNAEPSSACISATSSRNRSDERSTRTSLSMRACTERIACSSVVHCSNSAVSASTRLSIRRTLPLFLPRSPRSSSVCSASWRRWSARWRATWFSIRCAPSWTTCSSTCRRCGSSCAPSAPSSAGSRLSLRPISSPATRAASACRADSGKTRCSGTPSVRAVSRCCCAIWPSTTSSVASGSSRAS